MSEVKELLENFIGSFKLNRMFNHSETKGAYNLCDLSSKEDAIYKNWKLEEELQAEGLMVKCTKCIKFDFDPATESLKETHIRVDDPNDHAETYTYTVDIFSSMANGKISCKRYFIRK
uniref:Uncharacterized protein n=1 Tax=Wuchereria bancrofti TaxID=6293 RepID=A0AAF5PKK3_WUCBA